MYPQLDTYPKDLLKNRVILITGAYGGLGQHIAKGSALLGATTILLGRSLPHLEKLYDEIEQLGAPQPGIIPLDLQGAVEKDYSEIINTIDHEFGQLNGLVHCAATLGTLSPLESYPMSEWAKVMATNLYGPVLLTQACLPLMRKSSNASIIFSLDDHDTAYWGAYGISKAALKSFAKILADETEGQKSPQGDPLISVCGINPGPMRTRLRRKAFPGELPEETPPAEEKISHFIEVLSRMNSAQTGAVLDLS